jgi:hypothetical protein
MPNSLLRPLLILEFLVAIDAIFTLWSEVGGQEHLDLMFWPWKLVLGVGAALVIVAITAGLARNDGAAGRRVLFLCSILITIVIAAGLVTYYYHLNEPQDEDDDDGGGSFKTTLVLPEIRTGDPRPINDAYPREARIVEAQIHKAVGSGEPPAAFRLIMRRATGPI